MQLLPIFDTISNFKTEVTLSQSEMALILKRCEMKLGNATCLGIVVDSQSWNFNFQMSLKQQEEQNNSFDWREGLLYKYNNGNPET